MFEQLTDQLRVFINTEVNKDSTKKEKVEKLNNNDLFYKLINEHINKTAKGYADTLGLQYLGVNDQTVIDWINKFFENFDERITKAKEEKVKQEKAKKERAKKAETKKTSKKKDETYKVEEGLFGLEVTYKKKALTKPEFEEELKQTLKDPYELVWETDKVTVKYLTKEEHKENEKDYDGDIELSTDEETQEVFDYAKHGEYNETDEEVLEEVSERITASKIIEESENIEVISINSKPDLSNLKTAPEKAVVNEREIGEATAHLDLVKEDEEDEFDSLF